MPYSCNSVLKHRQAARGKRKDELYNVERLGTSLAAAFKCLKVHSRRPTTLQNKAKSPMCAVNSNGRWWVTITYVTFSHKLQTFHILILKWLRHTQEAAVSYVQRSDRGSQGLLLELIPSVSRQRQGTPWTGCELIAGPLGAILGAVFCSRLKDTPTGNSAQPGVAGIWTSNFPITSRPAWPAELQLPLCQVCLFVYLFIY